MHIKQLAIVGISTLALVPTAFAEGLAQDVDTLESQVAALEIQNAELLAIIEDLVALQRCHGDAGVDRRIVKDPNGNDVQLGVDWSGCDKRGIWLRAATYFEAGQLFNAKLVGTDFTSAWIRGVAMNGANLEGANFTNADLRGSILTGANIVTWQQAQDYAHLGLQETIFDNTLCPDGTNSDDVGGTCANNRTP